MKHEGIKGIIKAGKAPGVKGLNKGPNMTVAGRKQFCFERPDAVSEFEHDMGVLESKQKLSPQQIVDGKRTLAGLKAEKELGLHEKVDYGDTGHELQRNDL